MKKYYKWIPIIGVMLVLFNITDDDLELDLNNSLDYFGSMIFQLIVSCILITLFL